MAYVANSPPEGHEIASYQGIFSSAQNIRVKERECRIAVLNRITFTHYSVRVVLLAICVFKARFLAIQFASF